MNVGAVSAYVDGLDLFRDDLEGIGIGKDCYLLTLPSV